MMIIIKVKKKPNKKRLTPALAIILSTAYINMTATPLESTSALVKYRLDNFPRFFLL